MEEIVSWSDEDIGRRGGCGEKVAVYCGKIKKLSEVLRRRMMWRGCIDKKLRWWCVRSWDEIQMIHQSMRNGSRVAHELYIKRELLALEDFLFLFSLLILLYSKASYNFKTALTLVLS